MQNNEERKEPNTAEVVATNTTVLNDWYVKYTHARLAKNVDFFAGSLFGSSVVLIVYVGASWWTILPVIALIISCMATTGNSKVLSLGALNLDISTNKSEKPVDM